MSLLLFSPPPLLDNPPLAVRDHACANVIDRCVLAHLVASFIHYPVQALPIYDLDTKRVHYNDFSPLVDSRVWFLWFGEHNTQSAWMKTPVVGYPRSEEWPTVVLEDECPRQSGRSTWL